MPAETQPSDDDFSPRLSEAIESYIETVERGESVNPEEWVLRYPDISDELRECLAALKLIQRASASPSESRKALKESGGFSDVAAPIEEDSTTARTFGARGYTLLGEIGRGGMGVVYKALQHKTKRLVALKALHGDIHASPSARRRFEREVELAAALDHPGIVRILESGQVDGRDYYAMELVDGVPLHRWNAGGIGGTAAKAAAPYSESTLRAMLELFIAICNAVNYAHQRGVIHRDLKPSNIMVDRQGRPRILDFGLARTTESSLENSIHATRTGQIVGTLPYLCPEQASGAGDQVDVRGDLYSLGVILYEMLTGRPPYDTGGPLDEALHNIVHAIPARPSYTHSALRGDLDAITLKALEKAKEDRYQTAAMFAEDLRCYLRYEPVEANRLSRFYLLRKTYARHRMQIRLAAATVTLVVAFSIVITALYLQVREERRQIQAQLRISQLQRGAAHLAAGHDMLAEELLFRTAEGPLDLRARWSLLGYSLQNPLEAKLSRIGWVTSLAFNPQNRHLIAGTLDGHLLSYEPGATGPSRQVIAHTGAVEAIAIDPQGERIVTAGADGHLKVWHDQDWRPLQDHAAHPGGVTHLRFSMDGKLLLSAGHDGCLTVWHDLNQDPPQSETVLCDRNPVSAADFSPSGDRIAAAFGSARLEIIDRSRENARREVPVAAGPIEALRFNPSGDKIAVWASGTISLLDPADTPVESAREPEPAWLWRHDAGLPEPRPTTLWDFSPEDPDRPPTPHYCWRPSLVFSNDGKFLAVGGWRATISLWHIPTGRSLGELRSHGNAVYSMAFEANTLRLAAGCAGETRIWNVADHPGVCLWPSPSGNQHTSVAVSADGSLVAGAFHNESLVHLSRPRSSSQPWTLRVGDSPIQAIALDPHGSPLITADAAGRLSVWPTDRQEAIRAWDTGETLVQCLAISGDGQFIAVGGPSGRMRIWRVADGTLEKDWPAHSGLILGVAFSPDGRRLITGGRDWYAKLWAIDESEPRATAKGQSKLLTSWRHREWVTSVAFDPTGEHPSSGSADLSIHTEPVQGGGPIDIHHAHAHWVNAIAFLNDQILVSGGYDGAVRFWDATTGEDLAALPSQAGPVTAMAAARDGSLLVVGGTGGIQIFDVAAAERRFERLRKEE